jgi:hypothetical protein
VFRYFGWLLDRGSYCRCVGMLDLGLRHPCIVISSRRLDSAQQHVGLQSSVSSVDRVLGELRAHRCRDFVCASPLRYAKAYVPASGQVGECPRNSTRWELVETSVEIMYRPVVCTLLLQLRLKRSEAGSCISQSKSRNYMYKFMYMHFHSTLTLIKQQRTRTCTCFIWTYIVVTHL